MEGNTCFPQATERIRSGGSWKWAVLNPKIVVVKKTPKRVHNSDPSAMFSRSELLTFEDSMRSPGSVPGTMLSPSIKQGTMALAFCYRSYNQEWSKDLLALSCHHRSLPC